MSDTIEPRMSRLGGSDPHEHFDFDNINPAITATFVVERLATGEPMGLGPMSPLLAARVAAAWRGRKKVIAS